MNTRFLVINILFLSLFACNNNDINKILKYPYAMCEYKNGILVSNFGGDTLNYYNTQPTGFITYYYNGKNSVIIPPNSGLYSPKGIAVKDKYLFVADINRILVFDIDTKNKIDEIIFPQSDAFVNDVLIAGSTMFISVTNYNKIYLLNIDNPEAIDHTSLLEYLDIPYPSSMKFMGEYLFVTSNSFDGTEYEDKIIHIIDDLNNPSIRPVIHQSGDYQGLEFSPNKTRLIFCNQEKNGYIYNLVFENGNYACEYIVDENSLLSDLLILGDRLYISDLQNSNIYIREIIEFDGFANIIKSID